MENETRELEKKLVYARKNIYEAADEALKKDIFDFAEDYKAFLNAAKTERESVEQAVKLAEAAGFRSFKECESLKPGDKVYMTNRSKNVLLFVIGQKNITEGVALVGAHIDSPRLDLKPNPVFEAEGLGLLKTHYYGGIKKYQWTAIPLSLHGVVFLNDGRKITLNIGENDCDPVFCVTDLLPHLADEQVKKPAYQAIEGEKLNLLAGSIPVQDEEVKEKVKFTILKYLYETYSITEEDFASAELEAVPAGNARDVGLDRSLVGSYGQDDRVCAYTALRAILDMKEPQYTAACILVDKEETGSAGSTGFKSRFFESALVQLTEKLNGSCSLADLNQLLVNSMCLSADVSVAVDPNYPEVSEPMNSAYINRGVAICKYTGSRGKGGTSDANAEFLSKIRKVFSENGVFWQMSELGKVDAGGGGTIAQFVANMNIETLDCGTAVLSMHAPFEITSKADVYMTYKAYKSFFEMQ